MRKAALLPEECVDELFSSEETKCARAVNQLKFTLIGSNRQKHAIVEQGLVPRLVNLLGAEESTPQLKIDSAYALGSIAKGADSQVKALLDNGIVPVLIASKLKHFFINFKRLMVHISKKESSSPNSA